MNRVRRESFYYSISFRAGRNVSPEKQITINYSIYGEHCARGFLPKSITFSNSPIITGN